MEFIREVTIGYNMNVYDISIPLGPGTPIWDDGATPVLETLQHLERGDFATVTRFSMGSHSGTHVDAPAHFTLHGATVDRLSPAALVGPAVVVEYHGSGHIRAEDLDLLGVNGSPQRVLFKTSNQRLWEDASFRRDFVALEADAAERLIQRGVVLVGIDYLSIEPYESVDFRVHHALLGAGVVVLEGVDLRGVPEGEYLLVCAPLKLVGAEGAPTRVFLIEGAQAEAVRQAG